MKTLGKIFSKNINLFATSAKETGMEIEELLDHEMIAFVEWIGGCCKYIPPCSRWATKSDFKKKMKEINFGIKWSINPPTLYSTTELLTKYKEECRNK